MLNTNVCFGEEINQSHLVLDQHTHGHDQFHAHGNAHSKNESTSIVLDLKVENEKKNNNINLRAAVIHFIGDFVQSFGVLLASIIIYFKVKNYLHLSWF